MLVSLGYKDDGSSAGTIERPISAVPGRRRPITQYAKMRANVDRNPCYKAENVLTVELDMPDRTTQRVGAFYNAKTAVKTGRQSESISALPLSVHSPSRPDKPSLLCLI